MADLLRQGSADLDIEKALVALKKGSQLLKYGRKGRPKFYPFRLSNDESSLIWFSNRGERSLRLSSVSRIFSGQRTSVFQRYQRPENCYLSFSLLYNNGRRSLDLICKDKVEAEVWFTGLRALITSGQYGRSKIDGWTDERNSLDSDKNSIPSSPSYSSLSNLLDFPDKKLSISIAREGSQNLACFEGSDVRSMHVKGSPSDAFRFSVSSVPSSSSHGSAVDDSEAYGDVYVWGEVLCNSSRTSTDSAICHFSAKNDILLPKPLDSNVILDIQHVACGVKHAAFVTRHREVFTWGEESGGRLGHGIGLDAVHPRLVESLSASKIDFVACGEFHTCAVSTSGELYTWGDGAHKAGLLGHGTDISHWIPKRISGSLEGLQVAFVSCGTWHTALLTTAGQLFTFGDGTFGALGHGNRESALYPRELDSLNGLKTIAVSCGVWHTAAVVEVIVTQSSSSSGKLFTWGDGDKFRLGHGDKEPRLKPTCVPSLIDYNFHKVVCGHSVTIGLTTSGNVFTIGSTVYGQLGNPHSDGKLPCLVEDKLANEFVKEVACGSYHVAVLTSRNEVYTWGKGANGRLGHGDLEDRKTPMLVEALKDRPVKNIACGGNFTAAICYHKWVSSAEKSLCTACRQPFGFTRKRHNCYNCGLIHCHSCSSKKALRAALAPNPKKPYRVCDSCYAKLSKSINYGGTYEKKSPLARLSGDDKADFKMPKAASPISLDSVKSLDSKVIKQWKKSDSLPFVRPQIPSPISLHSVKSLDSKVTKQWKKSDSIPFVRPQIPSPISLDSVKSLDSKVTKQGKKSDSIPLVRPQIPRPQISSLLQRRDVAFSVVLDVQEANPRLTYFPVVQSTNHSRAISPFIRRSSPPRSATPIPTMSGLSFSKSIADSLQKTNELLNQEIQKLRGQVDSLMQQSEFQEYELQKSAKKIQEAMAIAAEESAKSKAAKEVIKSLTAQLKDLAKRFPAVLNDADATSWSYLLSNGDGFDALHHDDSIASQDLMNGSNNVSKQLHSLTSQPAPTDGISGLNGLILNVNTEQVPSNGEAPVSGYLYRNDSRSFMENSSKPSPTSENNQVEAEWIEQYEPGVYITLIGLRDGSRDLKRVRFSRRRFGEKQAESWWSENRLKVYEKFNVRGSSNRSSVLSLSAQS
ncbi:PH, RCC1 and FYVE domains-containing protein 1-like isoform X2 [Dendrobium catenatum]|uniref:Ultraviolet-B receptor UVR8 n=1 Tax=Dendrobium catenatum TaxID=906689 RepID=A0A2I0W5X3_9ASPA|nr:PH, RCC1 and FYVE domains-containing protein 1-like isoform X2 [Dendrobium catenatum]PKU71059.1 Ultraviolet-B receptor UVR8 [Dendrobium catenatum]